MRVAPSTAGASYFISEPLSIKRKRFSRNSQKFQTCRLQKLPTNLIIDRATFISIRYFSKCFFIAASS
jgi:hypothetical protein